MKLAAVILLACFTGYLSETIQIPLSISVCYKKATPCCERKAQCKRKLPAEKRKKSESPDCNTTCANCPLNSVTIFTHSISSFKQETHSKVSSRNDRSILPGYTADTWKPPDNMLA